jgi:hypothetical protein
MTFLPLDKHKTCEAMPAREVSAVMTCPIAFITTASSTVMPVNNIFIWKIMEIHTPKIL